MGDAVGWVSGRRGKAARGRSCRALWDPAGLHWPRWARGPLISTQLSTALLLPTPSVPFPHQGHAPIPSGSLHPGTTVNTQSRLP